MGSKEGYGWLSGLAIKSLALRSIYDAARVVNIPIIGVGGVARGEDVVEMVMAGAAAVQVCTEAILQGPMVYGKIVRELDEFLDSHGYDTIEAIRGLTIRRMRENDRSSDLVVPVVDAARCTLCGLCEISCACNAITCAKLLEIDRQKCFGCGLCVSRCRQKALRLS